MSLSTIWQQSAQHQSISPMTPVICPNCQKPVAPGNYCEECGKQFPSTGPPGDSVWIRPIVNIHQVPSLKLPLFLLTIVLAIVLLATFVVSSQPMQNGIGVPASFTAIPTCSDTLRFLELRSYLKSVEDESRRQAVIDSLRGCQVGAWEGWVDDFSNGGTRVTIDMDPPSIGSIHDVEFDVPVGFVGKLQKNQRIVFSGVVDYGASERRLGITSVRIYLVGATLSQK